MCHQEMSRGSWEKNNSNRCKLFWNRFCTENYNHRKKFWKRFMKIFPIVRKMVLRDSTKWISLISAVFSLHFHGMVIMENDNLFPKKVHKSSYRQFLNSFLVNWAKIIRLMGGTKLINMFTNDQVNILHLIQTNIAGYFSVKTPTTKHVPSPFRLFAYLLEFSKSKV